MTLSEVIDFLEACENKSFICKIGLGEPMSYRGYYDQLAFEPTPNITIAKCLENAMSALGQTFMGYKGGDYTMDEHTDCWLCSYGTSYGDLIGPILMDYITGVL